MKLCLPRESSPPSGLHIAIIMDGNRRWASQKSLPSAMGHRKGVQALDAIVRIATKRKDVSVLSIYALSTENLQRSPKELKNIYGLLKSYAAEKEEEFQKNDVSAFFPGNLQLIPKDIKEALETLSRKTKGGKALQLHICIAYGGKDEIIRATEKLIQRNLPVTEKNLESCLDFANTPPVDLLIRTGGKKRISNFLLWESAYAEIFFSDVLWPDFSEKNLEEALQFFAEQKRTFGK